MKSGTPPRSQVFGISAAVSACQCAQSAMRCIFMIHTGNGCDRGSHRECRRTLRQILSRAAGPVLVISTKVGRGMFSLGEAIVEQLPSGIVVEHVDIESLLPARGVQEDLSRYG